jgi:hypothetical protein
MSAITIAGDTSGSITLDAPAVAGSTVLTLPATSGTVAMVSGDLGTPSALVGTNITGTANALNAGLGVNQTWQDFTASRSVGVTYTNTSGKPIVVSICTVQPVPVLVFLSVNGIVISQGQAGGDRLFVSAIVPNGNTYGVNVLFGSITGIGWNELR